MLHKLIIVGAGPAGLTAAIYAARAGLKPIIIGGYEPGGQLMQTTEVENFPGFPEGIKGPELMDRFIKQAERWGAELVFAKATEVDFGGAEKIVKTEDGQTFRALSVIIATGAMPRKLAIPGEERYWGKGVSTCATCDGALYKGKTVAVIGGGDSAMEEANFLTTHVEKVYIVHRSDTLKASKIMQDRAKQNPKIEFVWNSQVAEVVGNEAGKVDHLVLQNTQSSEKSDLKVDGMFLAIGHIPVTGFLNGVALNELGYVESVDGIHTNIDGVFVAGDVEDHKFRQAITAAGRGCAAALEVQRWLGA
jgi:thioredoxin reductase (NADPH)